jgi:hypothetical protein
MPAGVFIALVGVVLNRRQPVVTIVLFWLAAIGLYMLAAIRTTSADWAYYYHVVAVPPAALLFGLGVASLGRFAVVSQLLSTGRRWRAAGAMLACAVILLASCAALLQEARQCVAEHRLVEGPSPLFLSAEHLAPLVPRDELVVATGGPAFKDGHPVAFNASYFFYWLDVKGFNIPRDQQNVAMLEMFRRQGAGCFVAEKTALRQQRGFEDELRQTYPLLGETDTVLLFKLTPLD